MKFPQTAIDIQNEVLNSLNVFPKVGHLRLRQLINILPTVSDDIIVEGVVKVLESNRTHYLAQQFCGKILSSVQPRTDMELQDILYRTLESWNNNILEFPAWMIQNYGLRHVKITLDDMEGEDLSPNESESLEALKAYLKLY
ncbi:hypothetical protein V6R21_08845 [Limibacter armeniacum]|uniref:hypothetical protein n=1 Tax=Limibacter armeniacum TaxID=466084 RepID=UPI002FE5594D